MGDLNLFMQIFGLIGKVFGFIFKATVGTVTFYKGAKGRGERQAVRAAMFIFLILAWLFGFYRSLLGIIFSICLIVNIVKMIKMGPPTESETMKSTSVFPTDIQSLEPGGVMFGVKETHYIIKPEKLDGHILIVGGAGNGKSSCIAIPTLRAWKESAFAIDIKGELYKQTKEHRPNIKSFNPLDENSYGYDPFYCLRTSHNPSQEARAIAQALIPLPPDIRDPYWIESAQNIFTASILHFSAQGKSFLETVKQIQGTTPRVLIEELCDSSEMEVRYFVMSFADVEDKTLSSVMSELSRNIVYFVTDKHLSSALSRANNITPEDLEYGNDVYINIPQHLLRQWKNLVTLIVNQFLTHFEQRSEEHAQPILFLLDEFPRLGKINTILDGLATLRSKKITIGLVIQSLKQLDTIYGERERGVILDNSGYKAVLGAGDADTQEYFSKLAGTYEKLATGTGTQKEAFTGMNKGTSTNTQEIEKRIIKPEEFGMLKDIVLFTPFPMPFEMQKADLSKSITDILIGSLDENSDIFVPFCRVDKSPYYEPKVLISNTSAVMPTEQIEIPNQKSQEKVKFRDKTSNFSDKIKNLFEFDK